MENNAQNGATTPTTNGVDTQTQVTNTPSVDYEQEYKKQSLEIEKLKNAISKTNSENAEYKRKELEKMSAEEKSARELQDLMESNKKMEAELRTMKLEKDLLANGFTGEESEKLINSNFAIKDIADIIKAKVDEAVKSAKAELLKGTTTTPPMGSSATNNSAKTKAQQIAEKEIGADTSKIKDYYKTV